VTAIVIAMLVIVALAAAVVVYVAFPHRGEDLPAAPWLSDAMTRAVDALPTVAPQEAGTVPVEEESVLTPREPAPGRHANRP